MKFFARMLAAIGVLAIGFALGVRFERRVESRSAVRATVEVQKAKIASLKEKGLRLKTALLLRDYLEEVRLRLPRATYRTMVDAITDASVRFGVPPETILAVIRIESTFDVDATSDAGAVGLMQLMPSTAQEAAKELRMDWPGKEILHDPAANIRLGTYYLTKLLGRFDDLSLALAAYNEGPARVAEREPGSAPPDTEYTRKVMAYAAP